MKKILAFIMAAFFAINAQASLFGGDDGELKIGMSIDDLRLERWQKDRDLFVAKAEELGAKVSVQSANGNEQTQISQIENMISRGVDVLVIIPYNGQVLSNVIAEAKREGIKVLAYDRLINNADIDFYISFDNTKVGELQASAIVKAVPEGRYFMMGGSPVDNNAKLFRQGQMNVIQPYVDAGKITIVGDQWVDSWLPENALGIMENALTASNNDIDAVVASNDGTAGGAIQALAAQGLEGKVAISGQDADLAAVQRVVAGTQTMTVYKPLHLLARKAAEIAVELGDDKAPATNAELDNNLKSVPSYLLEPIVVTKENVMETVIADGMHKKEDVYKVN
ncbi:D-xylose ABC transporter substrate-binding protein [Sansalvadorimonas sp. 2012CJ34-2]|uniref:D-xylose ABC transporter substrate-binding protein n=1 Tax=Parendozoicomonas callyspongiae TaxID=2942213 RepID=A0ABT0PKH4_9GAMM|nr:D-xylose ABC transporter substrate-binding protein [Sansalvadorimonas sp. 2012CJ34-2]